MVASLTRRSGGTSSTYTTNAYYLIETNKRFLQPGTYLFNETISDLPSNVVLDVTPSNCKTYFYAGSNVYERLTTISSANYNYKAIEVDSVNKRIRIACRNVQGNALYLNVYQYSSTSSLNEWHTTIVSSGSSYKPSDNTKLRTIVVTDTQEVTKQFYDWFIANTTKEVEPSTQKEWVWVANDRLTSILPQASFDINFYVDYGTYKTQFTNMNYNGSVAERKLYYDNIEVYDFSSNTWTNSINQAVYFTEEPTDELLEWLQANGDVEVINKILITFTISGTSYQAEEDMTWEEWVNSSYNTDGFIYTDNAVYTSNKNAVLDTNDSTIVANKAYSMRASGGNDQ